MPSAIDLLREVMTLTSNVNELKQQVLSLSGRVMSNTERIIRLENREELILEKAKNAFMSSAMQVNAQLIERIIKIEQGSPHIATDKQLPGGQH